MSGESKKLETQAEETFDFEKEWNEMPEDMESEEDTWTSVGIDDDEETLQKRAARWRRGKRRKQALERFQKKTNASQ